FAVRGQYGMGSYNGQTVPGYRQEPDVPGDSATETYAALKLHVDNWRWQDVPFYLRTGKRLPARVSEVFVQMQPVPHRSFPTSARLPGPWFSPSSMIGARKHRWTSPTTPPTPGDRKMPTNCWRATAGTGWRQPS